MAVNRAQQFSNTNEIDSFFKNYDANGFADWFNKNISVHHFSAFGSFLQVSAFLLPIRNRSFKKTWIF